MVGIVLGSESDLDLMEPATAVLEGLGISYELTICSAHRTPERAAEYAKTARERGLLAIIAGAGMAAHLPGVLAAYTTLPVIGVPLSRSPLQGTDALYSMVQMPPGVPVATVAIDGARNAAVLAAEIIGVHDEAVAARLTEYRREQARKVDQSAEKHGRRRPA